MGIRIHRAMGWGMSWHRFEELTLLECEAHETGDALYDVFHGLTDETMTVPRGVCSNSFKARHVPAILEPRLLAERFTDFGRRKTSVGAGNDLYSLISNGDEVTDIVFFPDLHTAKKWCRFDNDLDYAFERWREGGSRNADPDPRDFVEYTAYAPYPYTNYLMTESGEPHEWLHFMELRDRPDLVPAVCQQIRWYLTTHKILDDAGVNALRPLIAQWWG